MDQAENRGIGPIARSLVALLFCSPDPVPEADLAEAIGCESDEFEQAVAELEQAFAPGQLGLVVKKVGGALALASDPETELAVRRLLSKPRTPPLTQAQAECLAISAYLQPVSRPEIARIRGVNSDSAVSTLEERGLIDEKGRSQFGAILYRTTPLFEKLFGLDSLDDLPDIKSFEPTAEDEQELRDKLLKAGEQRVS